MDVKIMAKETIKCKTKYCRESTETSSGIHEPDGWLCDKCWKEKCREE